MRYIIKSTPSPGASLMVIIALLVLPVALVLEYQKRVGAEEEIKLLSIEWKQKKAGFLFKIEDQRGEIEEQKDSIAKLSRMNDRYKADSILYAETIIAYRDTLKVKQDSIDFLKKEYRNGYREGEKHAYDIMSKELSQKEQQRQRSLQKAEVNFKFSPRFKAKVEAIIRPFLPKKKLDPIEVILLTLIFFGMLFILVNIGLPRLCQFIDKHSF